MSRRRFHAMRDMLTRLLVISLFLCCCLKLAGTFGAELICRNTPNLTDTQLEMCLEVPRAIVVLSDVMETFKDECSWQFKTSRWNCTDVKAPVYVDGDLENSPEAAFVHALTSAITVHQITEACYKNQLGSYCSRDNSLTTNSHGHRFINPYNISAGRIFAQRFLDDRPLLVLSNRSSTVGEQIRAQLQIHNNGVGRHVVYSSRRTHCVCTGMSGSCSTKICITSMPSIFDIGDILKVKHEEAVRVEPVVNNGAIRLQLDERTREGPGDPAATELIYIATPTNHCQSDPEYTTSRYCLPLANLTSDPTLSQFYPPCEEFCCSGGYEATTKTVPQSCNCYFEFCCDLKCETCEETFTEYVCLGTASDTPSRAP